MNPQTLTLALGLGYPQERQSKIILLTTLYTQVVEEMRRNPAATDFKASCVLTNVSSAGREGLTSTLPALNPACYKHQEDMLSSTIRPQVLQK